jgi:orotate phosphoribosyltransferase
VVEKGTLGRLLLGVAYLEGDFVLRSGKRSRYYLDKYLFETEPRVLRGIVFEMALMMRNELAGGAVYQRLAAPELGAVALGAGLSLELGLPFLIVTSGGAALAAVDGLRQRGLVVEDLYCVVDREEGGREAAAAHGVTVRPLFTSSELGIASPASGGARFGE